MMTALNTGTTARKPAAVDPRQDGARPHTTQPNGFTA
jgi:hypothetical protein